MLSISPDGQRLRRIYGEKDLLISQSLRMGAFNDLDAAEVAALASVLVYQAKREDRGLRPQDAERLAGIRGGHRGPRMVRTGGRGGSRTSCRSPVSPSLAWSGPCTSGPSGRHLQEVLNGTDLAAGDFVRWVKQVIDLLDQLAKIPGLDPRLARLCARGHQADQTRRRRLLLGGLSRAVPARCRLRLVQLPVMLPH